MTRLYFSVGEDGTLGATPCPPPVPTVSPASHTSGWDSEDEEDDDLPGGASFAALDQMLHTPSVLTPDIALALFTVTSQGDAQLTSWPRNRERAVIPSQVAGHPVTGIGPLAFAPMQLTEAARWADLHTSPVSFSVFCMRNARWLTPVQSGPGPCTVQLPDSIRQIGDFAFWNCTRLESLSVPDAVEVLGAGVFAGCAALAQVTLPQALRTLGYFPPATAQAMPDVGVFSGCHALQRLSLPEGLRALGAYAFNSCGITCLDTALPENAPAPVIHPTAFEHSAALQWLERRGLDGTVLWRIGLPAARDKILRSDPRSGVIAEVPRRFFYDTPAQLDELAFSTGRADFLGRMAIARLAFPARLSDTTAVRYLDFLARHYDALPQFWPAGQDAYHAALALMASSPYLTANHLNRLLRQSGELHLPQDLIAEMIALRNERFRTVTGFEDLEL